MVTGIDISLPPLRQDLRLHQAAPDRDGSPAWSIQDPVTNRFFRIGWLEFECLVRWPGNPAQIAAAIAAATPMSVATEQVIAFACFLEQHRLVRPTAEGVASLVAEANQPGWKHWRWWLHHYLFIRVPLVRPDQWLARVLPWVRPILSPLGFSLIVIAILLGLLLIARQWDQFTHGVMEILTPAGISGFILALAISKIFHELGHALVATHFGVRVSHMGIALVVLWPMLYTDTSESWKLCSSRWRLAISTAGLAVEMTIAGLSTLAWALLDDGPMRQAALYLATTGWALSLALNASPFMRFDGYFILSDLIDFPNLHERAGSLCRAWLRRTLLGWIEPDPEDFPLTMRKALIAFALLTWTYRLVVFLGIAVMVYLYFFKVLGIFLFAVEVSWFIARPFWNEFQIWWRRRHEIKTNRRYLMLGLGVSALLLTACPWAFDVTAPGIAHPKYQKNIYSPFPARVVQLHKPGAVTSGTQLALFDAPDLQTRSVRIAASIDALNQRLKGVSANSSGLDLRRVTTEELTEQMAEATATHDEEERLSVVAEFDGIWLDVDPNLQAGSWVSSKDQIGILIDPGRWIVDAYVGQRQVQRLVVGAPARFRPEKSWLSVDARIIDIDQSQSKKLSHIMLDATHGGPIATQAGDKQSVPADAVFRVRLELAKPLPENHETRGQATIQGHRYSLLWEVFKRTAAVIVRESGF